MQAIEVYFPAVWAMVATGGLLLLQILVVDVASMKAKHPPGTPVPVDRSNFLFRATRAHANTNENIAAFVLLTLSGMLLTASPAWLNGFAWTYVFARAGHMLFYYANQGLLRSSAFGLGLVALLGLLGVSLAACLS